MQELTHKVVFLFAFLYKNSLKNSFSVGVGEQFGEQKRQKPLIFTDLVKMMTMPQCCKLCGAYQGKVYSISGKDKRFPALFKTVLRSGYALPHPNCRHEFIPFFEDMEAAEDVDKAIQSSKIKYDAKGNLVDVRYQRDIKTYQSWQAGNRQLNRELLEYEQMKSYYAGREDEMPYKTLGAFRKARRADDLSPAFKAWKNRKRDQRQY